MINCATGELRIMRVPRVMFLFAVLSHAVGKKMSLVGYHTNCRIIKIC